MVFNAYMVMCMYLVFSFIFVWYMYNKHEKVKKWQGERQDLKKNWYWKRNAIIQNRLSTRTIYISFGELWTNHIFNF